MKGHGVVTSLDGNKAYVQVTRDAECMGCASKSHCGFGEQNNRKIVVLNDRGARVSDSEIFEAESMKVILSSVLIWIVPLLAMMVGYFVVKRFSGGFLPIGASLLFLVGAFGCLKFVDDKLAGGRSFYPNITRIVDSSESKAESCPGQE